MATRYPTSHSAPGSHGVRSRSTVAIRLFAFATAALLAAVVLVGCGDADGEPSAWTFRSGAGESDTGVPLDPPPDVGPRDTRVVPPPVGDTGDRDDDRREPVATEFVIEKRRDAALFLKNSRETCTIRGDLWVSILRNGTEVVARAQNHPNPCSGPCTCGQIRTGGGCVDCGPIACPSYTSLVRRKSRTWTWGGSIWEDGRVDGTACNRPTTPERGTELVAEFCWKRGGTDDELRECAMRRFRYGVERRVVHTVERR